MSANLQSDVSTKVNLLNFNRAALQKYFTDLGEKPYRATQIINWIHQQGVTDFSLMTNLSLKLRNYLADNCAIIFPEIARQQISKDGTQKWLFRLIDNEYIETVFIPETDRGTLCVSSQVGCALNCGFCNTGKMGFKRHLSVAEIIAQLWLAISQLSTGDFAREKVITNVVMMGMGEPLLNFDNVVAAMDLMLDDHAYGLSKYRVTLSTSGIVPAMEKLREVSKVSLAVSLHAPNDELRNKIMPVNKKYPLVKLIAVCRDYFRDEPKRAVTFEYVMIKDLNDSLECAKQLVKLLRGVNCKINLIPFNPILDCDYKCSSQKTIDVFRDILLQAGFNTITRKTRGCDIDAACGQLAIRTKID